MKYLLTPENQLPAFLTAKRKSDYAEWELHTTCSSHPLLTCSSTALFLMELLPSRAPLCFRLQWQRYEIVSVAPKLWRWNAACNL